MEYTDTHWSSDELFRGYSVAQPIATNIFQAPLTRVFARDNFVLQTWASEIE
jgi:hypothetical protein